MLSLAPALIHSPHTQPVKTPHDRPMPTFVVTADGGGGLRYPQTRSKKFTSPTRGLRVGADAPWLDIVKGASLLLPKDAAFSHQTALRIYGIDFGDKRPLHVSVPLGANRGSRGLVRWHRSDLANQRLKVAGVIVTTPWKTWCDLGAVLSLPLLVAATDLLLRRRLLTRDELTVPKCCRGAENLRKAAKLADPRSNSIRESELRVHIHEAGLPAPEVNLEIYVDGGWVSTSDLVWREYRTIVEYDGPHHLTPKQKHQDSITRAALRAAGWEVMELDAKHFKRLRITLAEIEETLRSRGWNP